MNTQTMNKSNNSSKNIITPKAFAEVESIANDILAGNSIIVDLTGTDIAEAKRICDFLNGVTFAIGGSVEKIVRLVYLFNPKFFIVLAKKPIFPGVFGWTNTV